ncbi:hypothetical protein [Mycoplasma suis]|uniref:hypothetical protein n=1 Tax=Mycoplasma suis TaxID=57372 RepID=UPI0011D25CBC|nr:hypothetical protein [Mycoplasma suis]
MIKEMDSSELRRHLLKESIRIRIEICAKPIIEFVKNSKLWKRRSEIPYFRRLTSRPFFLRRNFLFRSRSSIFHLKSPDLEDFSFDRLRVRSLRTGRVSLFDTLIKENIKKLRFRDVEIGRSGLIVKKRRGW